ncbi:MAG: M42 family metallopeptidase [Chitinophagales bacterium]|nr:M42 family metallopeptidase [Chitinophagales bacterium]
MAIDVKLLKEICETPGVPGYEQKVRELVHHYLDDIADEIYDDNMGNVIAIKKGTKDKAVMAAAHMDEIGFMVTHIDDNGFLRFNPLGGFDPKTLTAQRVVVHGKKDLIGVMGSKPIHLMSADERKQGLKISDFFIDLGMDGDEVKKLVDVGTPITRERKLIEMGDCVNSKSLDNRISVFILIEAMKELKDVEIPYDLQAVFTVQEEVGLRGAMVAAHGLNPDFGLGLDVTIAYDVPGSKPEEQITQLGGGVAIKIMDTSTIADYRMVAYMKELCDDNKIKWQPEILTGGGTDTAGIQRMSKNGSIAGCISIPTRHVHQVIEMANKEDIRAAIDLLKLSVQNLDSYDWSFK